MTVLEHDDAIGNRVVARDIETRIRELDRQLGRRSMEVDILKEHLVAECPEHADGARRQGGLVLSGRRVPSSMSRLGVPSAVQRTLEVALLSRLRR